MFLGFEMDKDYYDIACKRIKEQEDKWVTLIGKYRTGVYNMPPPYYIQAREELVGSEIKHNFSNITSDDICIC